MRIKFLILSLLLGIAFLLAGCGLKTYSIVLEINHDVSAASAGRAAVIEGPEYMTKQSQLIARIIDDSGSEVTSGTVAFTTSTPEALVLSEITGTDRSVMMELLNWDSRQVAVTVTYTPIKGDVVVREQEFAVAYHAKLLLNQGIDFDTRLDVGTIYEQPNIVGGDDPAAAFVLVSSELDDSDPDCRNWIWTITLRAPYGYKAIPGPAAAEAFAVYEDYPAGDLTDTEFISDDFNMCTWFFVVESAVGKKYKVVIRASGFGDAPLYRDIEIDYQELLP